MRLTFNKNIVKQLREHAASATTHRSTYGQDKPGPGLWLVGDEGVYLMSNGHPHQDLVAYAKQCNPKTMPFDQWWAAKQATFGGDDGVEFIDLSAIPESGDVEIEITPNTLTVYGM
jgi:hypothetical protein